MWARCGRAWVLGIPCDCGRDLENECRRVRVQLDVQVLWRRAGFDGLEADLKVREGER